MNKNLFVITESYPYIGGEQFLYNEFEELSKYYDKIIFFPLSKKESILECLPKNFIVNNTLNQVNEDLTKKNLIKNIRLLISITFTELLTNKKGIYFFKKPRLYLATIKKALSLSSALKKELNLYNYKTSDHLLSTWMNIGALSFSILKYKNQIGKFSFRVNGYDIFDERHVDLYMPFRAFNFKLTNKVIVLSKAGYNYLKAKKIYPNKLRQNYSGLFDLGLSKPNIEKDEFTIVSCSNIISIKRVDLIAKALKILDIKIKWIHFGDGNLKRELELICKDLPTSVNYELRGSVEREKIIDFYKNERIDLFVHPSETEGLGMAIIEAQSFGIPAIGCNVGGVPEIITNETGILLKEDITEIELAKAISEFKPSLKDSMYKQHLIKSHFNKNFNIKNNVIRLIDELN